MLTHSIAGLVASKTTRNCKKIVPTSVHPMEHLEILELIPGFGQSPTHHNIWNKSPELVDNTDEEAITQPQAI